MRRLALSFQVIGVCSIVCAQSYVIQPFAGGGIPRNGPAIALNVSLAKGVAVDDSGNLYFCASNAVYRMDRARMMIRIAGRPGLPGFSGDGALATSAQLNSPVALAIDTSGSLLIADSANNRIRKVTSAGIISTTAGTGVAGYSGDGHPATNALMNRPAGLALDAAGNLYVADNLNSAVRKVTPTGNISTVAGTGYAGYSGDGGPATSAQLHSPQGLAVDSKGNLYFADSLNFRIRMVTTTGIISTVAGGGAASGLGDGGPATSAVLGFSTGPTSVALDAAGNLYIADSTNNRVRVVTPAGFIFTVAGNGSAIYSGEGGLATSAQLPGPRSLAVGTSGNLYIADTQSVREVSPMGIISTVAGSKSPGDSGDGGPATSAQLYAPRGMVFDRSGNLYVSDESDNCVRKVTPAGLISTVAGNQTRGDSGDGGPATSAQLASPGYLAFDSIGNLYIADQGNGRVRKVTPAGIITTVAGTGTSGYSGDGGTATSAQLRSPSGLAFDSAGNLLIADEPCNCIRKVTPAGIISTIAGDGTYGYSGDGGPATSARLNGPGGIAFDSSGNLYVADSKNNRLRKVTPAGIITTFAGNGLQAYAGNGVPAATAPLGAPSSLAFDALGNLYIADSSNFRVEKVTPSGILYTVAGNGIAGNSGDFGPAAAAQLNLPTGLALDSAGNLYVATADYLRPDANGIRLLVPQDTRPVLATAVAHAANFREGDSRQDYSIIVTNAEPAGPTTGTVTVTDVVPGGLSLLTMTGSGWTCSGNSCSRGDALAQDTSYPPLTVTVNVDLDAGIQFDNQATLTGGGVTYPLYVSDTTTVCPFPLSAQGASLSAEVGDGSIQVNAPADVSWTALSNDGWIRITGGASGSGSGTVSFSLQSNTAGARTGTITIDGQTFTIQQASASTAGLSLAGSLAQIASAGGWDTSLTLVNLGTAAGKARLSFYDEDGNAPWLAFTFPQQPSLIPILGATFDENIGAAGTLVLDTTGPAGQASVVGSAQLLTNGAVNGFAIFQIQASGQQAVVPLEGRNAPSYLLAFDHTNGIKTGLGLANVSAAKGDVKVVVRDDTGAVIPTKVASIPLSGNGHASFMLDDPTQGFPEIEGKRGTVEFDTPSGGQISVLGLRANGTAITTLPVLAQVGTTGGALAQVSTGGGWETGFTLVNTGSSAASFALNFYDEKTGVPLPLSVRFPQADTTQTTTSVTHTLAPGATVLIQTEGGSANVTCSAQLTTTGQVSGFATFQVLSTGQEAVVPLETRTPKSFVLAYDNTNGLATGLALANLSSQIVSVTVVARDDTGATLAQNQIQLVGNGHTQFMLTNPVQGFPVTDGKRGAVEFQVPSGGLISALGIRAVASTGVITTIPVLAKQ